MQQGESHYVQQGQSHFVQQGQSLLVQRGQSCLQQGQLNLVQRRRSHFVQQGQSHLVQVLQLQGAAGTVTLKAVVALQLLQTAIHGNQLRPDKPDQARVQGSGLRAVQPLSMLVVQSPIQLDQLPRQFLACIAVPRPVGPKG